MTKDGASNPETESPQALGRNAIRGGFVQQFGSLNILQSVASVLMEDKSRGDKLVRETIDKMAIAAYDEGFSRVGIDFLAQFAAAMTRDGLQARKEKDKGTTTPQM